MSVVLSNEEVGPCRRALRVEVPVPAVEAESIRVVSAIRREAKLPGFRKGKVPEGLIKKRFREEIEKELLDRLVPRYWQQAQDEASLEPMLAPQVDEVVLKEGEPLTFRATVDVKPEIELRNLEDFDLPEVPTKVGTDEVDQAIDEVRRQRGTWNPVERDAARGDRVALQVKEIKDPLPEGEEEPEYQPVEVEVGDSNVWEELSLAVTGLSAGKETEFARREDESDPATERKFHAKVEAVKELEMPELDDEFAKGLGEFEDVAALKADVEKQILQGKQNEGRRQRESALLKQLAERHPFPIPQGVVDHEVRHMLEDYATGLMRRGVDLESANLNWEEMAEQGRPQAENQVRVRLLLDRIAEERSIEVSDDRFEATIAALARAQGTSSPALRKSLDETGKLSGLRAQLRRETVVKSLLGEDEPTDEPTDEPG